jgi:hypothetical protein
MVTFTTFDAPGAGTGTYQGTLAVSINSKGATAGDYDDASSVYHGFVRAAGGTLTTFDAPGAGTATYQGTDATSINTAGTIVGYSVGASGTEGFVRTAKGTFTTFAAPGALSTVPQSINTAGVIAGDPSTISEHRHLVNAAHENQW